MLRSAAFYLTPTCPIHSMDLEKLRVEERSLQSGTKSYSLCLVSCLVLAAVAGCASSAPVRSPAVMPAALTRLHVAPESLEWLEKGLAAEDPREKKKCFLAAVSSDNQNAAAHNNLGIVYLGEKDYYRAARELEIAAQLEPFAAEPLFNLGLLFETVGKPDRAVDYYRRCLRLSEDGLQTKECLARAHIANGQDAEAEKLLREALELEVRPDWLLWIKEELERIEEARRP